MDEAINNRVLQMAEVMLSDRLTVREVANRVGVSKSTVHKDLKERLRTLNYGMYLEVAELLEFNKNIRHIRGGQSTKEKYAHTKYQ